MYENAAAARPDFAVVGPAEGHCEPGIPKEMKGLAEQVEHLKMALDGLRSRLAPMLRPDGPASVGPPGVPPAPPSDTDLANAIRHFASGVREVRCEIESIARRIDH